MMIRKFSKALLMLVMAAPLQGSKKCETFCNLIVTKCLRVNGNELVVGNLGVGGTLTVGGVNFSNLAGLAGTIGATGATGATGASLGTLVSSIIPFASGAAAGGVAPINLTAGGLAITGFVMGFGDNLFLTGLVDPALTTTYGSFAFTVPFAGTLSNLWGSVDASFLLAGVGTGPYPITYTIYHSSAVNGTTTPYTATALTATASLTSPTLAAGLRTAFGNNTATTLTVAAGDRIVLVVAPTAAIPAGVIGLAGFQAGMLYSPA